MAESTGGMNFKVCCPDCDVEQIVGSTDIIFLGEDSTEATFACLSESCFDSLVKQVEISGKLGIAEHAKQGKVEAAPTTFYGFLIFLESALKNSDSTTVLDMRNITLAKVLHAFSVLHLKSTKTNPDPRAVVWHTAVVKVLEDNPEWVVQLEKTAKGPFVSINRAVKNLVSQASDSALTQRLVDLVPTTQKAQQDLADNAKLAEYGQDKPRTLPKPVSFRPSQAKKSTISENGNRVPPRPSPSHRIQQSV